MKAQHGLIYTALSFCTFVGIAISGCSTLTPSETKLVQDACRDDIVARPVAQTLVGAVNNPLYTAALKHLESDFDIICANPNAAPSDNILAMLKRDGPLTAQLVQNLQARQAGKSEPFPTWEADLINAIPTIASEIPPSSTPTLSPAPVAK